MADKHAPSGAPRYRLPGERVPHGLASLKPHRQEVSGRIRKRALSPGRYRATLVARDAAGNASRPKRLAFRIVRG